MNADLKLMTRDPIIYANFAMLQARTRGQKFYIGKHGVLEKLEGLRKICFFFFTGYKQKVRHAINAVVRAIDEKSESKAMAHFFFYTLSPLSSSIFDRGVISEPVENALSCELAKIKEVLASARQGLQALGKASSECKELKDRIKHLDYDLKAASVAFANRLGIPLKLISGGSSGVYLGKNRHGVPTLAFKPEDEGPYGKRNPKWKTYMIRKVQGLIGLSRPSLAGHAEPSAEIWASRLDSYLELDIVPLTKKKIFKCKAFIGASAKEGSAQIWESKAQEASHYVPSCNGLFYWSIQRRIPVSRGEFEKLVILDFLAGNQDRDTDNWSIKTHGPDKGKIVAFDNGLAFPHFHPTDWMSTRKQHMWGELHLAAHPFSHGSVGLIKEKLQEGKAEQLFTYLGGLSEGQKAAMADRMSVLRHFAEKGLAISSLSRIKRKTDFAAFFKKISNKTAYSG